MGFVIGAYRAVEHLGGGGSGHRVSPFWRAEDTRTLEDVALTVLPAESAEPVRDVVEAVGDIRHPHLLPVSDVVEDQTRCALVSPWPRGGRLTELIRRRGGLSVGETVTVLLPLAAALAELHRDQVRHGWVCPEAIWFDARGRPLLGATAVAAAVADVAGLAALGSADVAPEVFRQARSGPPGTAADVFSLGSVALFAVTGRSAWPADEPADVLVQSAAGQWPDLPDDVGSAELVALVRSMLRPDPAARPTADAVVRRLSAGGLGDPAPIRFGSGPCPTPASAKRWRGWAGHPAAAPTQSDRSEAGPAQSARSGAGPVVVGPAGPIEPAAARGTSEPERAVEPRAAAVRRTAVDPAQSVPGESAPGAPAELVAFGDHHVADAAAMVQGEHPDADPGSPLGGGPASRGVLEPGDPEPDPVSDTNTDPVSATNTGPVADTGSEPAPDDRPSSPPARPERARRARRGPLARLAVAVLTGLLLTVLVAQVGQWVGDAPTASVSDAVPTDWTRVVTDLDLARSRALAAGDPAMLDQVYLPGSAAAAADAALVERLADQGLRVVDGTHDLVGVEVLDPAGADGTRLAVLDTLAARPVLDASGRQVAVTPARGEQRRVLVLASTDAGYRISAIEPG